VRLQRAQRTFLVRAHEARIACDVGSKDRSEFALNMLPAVGIPFHGGEPARALRYHSTTVAKLDECAKPGCSFVIAKPASASRTHALIPYWAKNLKIGDLTRRARR